MAREKNLIFPLGTSSQSVTFRIQRVSDNFWVDNADGAFRATPAVYDIPFTEEINGTYLLNESRVVWQPNASSPEIFVCFAYINSRIVGWSELVVHYDSGTSIIKAFGIGGISDVTTQSLKIIEAEHAKIYEGCAYETSGKFSVANGENLDFLITIPNTISFMHLFEYTFGSDTAPADIFLYEGSTISASGNNMHVHNMNRLVPDNNKVLISSGCTVSTSGLQLEYGLITGTKQEGGSLSGFIGNMVFKPNILYVIRYANRATGTAIISFNINWFEQLLP